MKRIIKLACVLPLVATLGGCVVAVGDDFDRHDRSDWRQRQADNREHIDRLSPGMMYAEVRHRMGMPDFREVHQNSGDTVTVLYYRTDSVTSDGVTSKDECTPLVFRNDVLEGWGERALANI